MALIQEQANMMGKLRSLFLLLDPNVSSLSEAEVEERKKLLQRMDYFILCSNRQAEYYRICLQNSRGSKYTFGCVLSRFMQLLRECVLSHQWPEALNLIQSLCYEMRGVNSAIWKVGLGCLMQDPEKNGRLAEQFVKVVCVLQSLTVVEVLLDFLLFLLAKAETADAKDLIKDLIDNTKFKSNLRNQKRLMAHSLFYAYQGLAFYADWKLIIFKVSQGDDDVNFEGSQADEISRRMNHGATTDNAKTVAQNALEFLNTVKDVPGVWDIFITRLIEIHEYYAEIETARNILRSYRDRNHGNPNAHRYLYEFESRNGGEVVVLVECLQDIIHLDPCNPLCLALYHLREKNDPGAVSLLFDYLDFTHCSQHEEIWQVLADTLSDANSHNLDDVLKHCWETRRDWWPNFIFNDLDQDESDPGLSEPGTLLWNKRKVWDVLLHLDEPRNKKRKLNLVAFWNAPGSKRPKLENPE